MPDIKRPNYYTSQFLVEENFREEQAYHVDMRRLHNRMLYGRGVVTGLTVSNSTVDSKKVTVSPGLAIAKNGQELLLPDDLPPREVDLRTAARGSTVSIVILYETYNDSTDLYADGPLKGKPKHEAKRAEVKASPPAPDDDTVVKLATVTIDANGDVGRPDNSARQLATTMVAKAGDLEVRTLRWGNNSQLNIDQGGSIELGGDSNAAGTGSPYIDFHFSGVKEDFNARIINDANGRLSVLAPTLFASGKVGIGTASPPHPLTIRGIGLTEELMSFEDATGRVRWHINQNRGARGLNLAESGVADGRLFIQAGGNVGISTTSPADKLDVAGNIKMSGVRTKLFYRGDADAHVGSLGFYSPDGGRTAIITPYDSRGADIPNSSVRLGGFGSFDTSAVSLLVSGNVGIGTANPSAKLEVAGGAIRPAAGNTEASGIMFPKDPGGGSGDGAWIRYYARSGEATTLELGTLNDPDDHLALMPSGNVGVGTTNPQDKLHVSGGGLRLDNNRGLFISDTAGAAKRVLFADASNVLHIGSGGGLGFNQIDFDMGNAGRVMTLKGGGSTINNVFVGEFGHGGDWAGFSHSSSAGAPSYALLQRGDGQITLINKKSGAGHIGFRIDNVDKMVILDNGAVGIGTTAPTRTLDVRASGIKLGLEANGGGQLILANNPNDNSIYLEAFSADGNSSAAELFLTGRFAVAVPKINLVATTTDVYGDLAIRGRIISGKGGFVMDQFINKLGEAVEEGDVVVIGSNQSSLSYGQHDNIPIPEVDLAQQAYDTAVCGIVSEVFGELGPQPNESGPGPKAKGGKKKVKLTPRQFAPEELEKLGRTQVAPGQLGWMVTLGAYAHCKVDADIAPIKIGDLLTTSPTKGHAQKVLDPTKAIGAIIGKALGSLKAGKGKIPVMVLLQ